MVARESGEDSGKVAKTIHLYGRGEIENSKWGVEVDENVVMPSSEKLVVPCAGEEDVEVCKCVGAYSYRKGSVARGRGRIGYERILRKSMRMAEDEFSSPSGGRDVVDLRKVGEADILEDEGAVDAKETFGMLEGEMELAGGEGEIDAADFDVEDTEVYGSVVEEVRG